MMRSRVLRRPPSFRNDGDFVFQSRQTGDAQQLGESSKERRRHGRRRLLKYLLGAAVCLACLRLVWTTRGWVEPKLSSPDVESTCRARSRLQEIQQTRRQGSLSPLQKPVVGQRLIPYSAVEHLDFEPRVFNSLDLRWPPLVTAIPEVQHTIQSARAGLTTLGIDTQFCSGEPRCRFLLPLWIGEQESRGRMHLTQLVHLAAELNRTLVLPNVGKSRLGLCGKWAFETYYDMASMARHARDISDGTRIYLMDDFKTWVDMRPDPPQGQILFLYENATSRVVSSAINLLGGADGLDLYVDSGVATTPEDKRLKNAYCLKTKFRDLSLNQHRPLSLLFTPPNTTASLPIPEAGSVMASLLLQNISPVLDLDSLMPTSVGSPDILLVHWELRHLPFASPQPTPSLQYSEKLWDFAFRLTAPYGNYLAIHWRMETVETAVLSDCAEALVDTLTTILGDPALGRGVGAVWLATDVPWSIAPSDATSVSARSNTFKSYAREHDEAIGIVKSAFGADGPLHHWKLIGLSEEIARLRAEVEAKDEQFVLADEDDDGLLWQDSGVWGILDKIVAMRSALFVSSVRRCGRVSSFTQQIVDYRTAIGGESKLRNVVEHFG